MKKLLLTLACLLIPTIVFAWTATVEFTEPTDLTYRTVVLVSETSGDYGNSYGQISKAGANTVSIANIKADTQYYFIAYRLSAENERSENSVEYPFLTPTNIEPTVIDLPPLSVGGQVLNIQISVE